MKRLVPAVCCLLSALALSVGSFMFIRAETLNLCSQLEAAADSSAEDLFTSAKKICAEWERVRTPFGALLKHSDADELEKSFLYIKDRIADGSETELREACGECVIALKVILEGEKPDTANIF